MRRQVIDGVHLAATGGRRSPLASAEREGFPARAPDRTDVGAQHAQSCGVGAHAVVAGTIALPILVYGRTGIDNNSLYPQVAIVGNAEIAENLFFVDGAIRPRSQAAT